MKISKATNGAPVRLILVIVVLTSGQVTFNTREASGEPRPRIEKYDESNAGLPKSSSSNSNSNSNSNAQKAEALEREALAYEEKTKAVNSELAVINRETERLKAIENRISDGEKAATANEQITNDCAHAYFATDNGDNAVGKEMERATDASQVFQTSTSNFEKDVDAILANGTSPNWQTGIATKLSKYDEAYNLYRSQVEKTTLLLNQAKNCFARTKNYIQDFTNSFCANTKDYPERTAALCQRLTQIVVINSEYLTSLTELESSIKTDTRANEESAVVHMQEAKIAEERLIAESLSGEILSAAETVRQHNLGAAYARQLASRLTGERKLLDAYDSRGGYYAYNRRVAILEKIAAEARKNNEKFTISASGQVLQEILAIDGEITARKAKRQNETMEKFQDRLKAKCAAVFLSADKAVKESKISARVAKNIKFQTTSLIKQLESIEYIESKLKTRQDWLRMLLEQKMLDYFVAIDEASKRYGGAL